MTAETAPENREWANAPDPEAVEAIRAGIENGEFELHYQPLLDIQRAATRGVEALLRWRRAGELLAPGQFLPHAEASDVIGPLTDHVLELALSQASAWRQSGRVIPMAINISPANLADHSVADKLASLLSHHGVAPETITLEVTETAVLDNPEAAKAVLCKIADLGVSISIDDFGTGYSSLLWLRMFPVDQVKIDRAFVFGLPEEGEVYVAGAIHLGHDLGLEVVAEGVENIATLRLLQELGCDVAQGYLFSRPVPAASIETWLSSVATEEWAPHRRDLTLCGPDDLDSARALIEEAATAFGYDETAIWEMKVAATEAVMNALEHGTADPDGVRMRLQQERDSLIFEISGGSAGGSVASANGAELRPRGRGITMMTALMDSVELKQTEDSTRVILAKRRQDG